MVIFGSRVFRTLVYLCALPAAFTLTGCGIGALDNSVSSDDLATHAISGTLYGGPTPLVGATIKLYATGTSTGGTSTNNTAYGAGTFLAEATQVGTSAHQDTKSDGTFTIPDGYDCPAGQFAYLVSTGGSTGSTSANNNSALVAALGRCEDLFKYNATNGAYTGYKGTNIYINELTTIAAAYALGHFATEVSPGTGASTQVFIGAPATNNAAQVSGTSTGCVAGTGACTTTAAAGLAHAFINASLLVNVFANSGVGTGANATIPGNNSAIVPQQLINTLGNILISCINSIGGTAGDTSVCGKLFTLTTIGTSVPKDTWGAMVNLAANPTLGASSTNVNSLYVLAAPSLSIYNPSYASVTGINDYSIAINYPAAAFSMTYPYTGATDINDVFYAASTAGSGTAPARVVAFNYTRSTNNTITVNASSTNASFTYTYGISLDALGNGYFGNGAGSTALAYFATNNGAPTTINTGAINANGGNGVNYTGVLNVYATAVDLKNQVWTYGNVNQLTSYLYVCPASLISTSQCTGKTGGATWNGTVAGAFVAVDPDQNVWDGSGDEIDTEQNSGTLASPTYSGYTAVTTTADPILSITFAGSSTSYKGYTSGLNVGYHPGLQTITPTLSGVQVTALTAGTNQFGVPYGVSATANTMTNPYGAFADGLSTVWIADYADHAIFQTTPAAATPTAYRLIPCLGGSTTCSSIFTSPSGTTSPTSVAVDASGSLWVTAVFPSSPYSGQVVQIIGSAAPTWPLLSLGKTGQP